MNAMPSRMLGALLLAGALSGCATLAGDSTQKLNIQTVDGEGRIVEGMSCHASNASADYIGVTPMFDMKVRRSSSPLVVECRRDGLALARAVVVSRAVNMQPAQMLLPGGTSMMIIDHISGFMYAYPRWVRLQVGADMVFDRRDEQDRGPTPGLVTRQFDDFVRFAAGGPTTTK
ncbi:MAG TPA: hypothetical protein VMK32_11810 [Burkholderiaceae bacterium]|nr:hypothetical protein [Burkholderiaceae bacterium]